MPTEKVLAQNYKHKRCKNILIFLLQQLNALPIRRFEASVWNSPWDVVAYLSAFGAFSSEFAMDFHHWGFENSF